MQGVHRLGQGGRLSVGLTWARNTSLAHLSQKSRSFCLSHQSQNTHLEEEEVWCGGGQLRMEAWQSQGYDGVEGLTLGVVRIPPILLPSQVLVRVQATSVNPLDTMLISGYGRQVLSLLRAAGHLQQGILDSNSPEFPLTGGRDFVGEVVGVGQGVRAVKVGERVLGVVSPQHQGSHAEYVVTPASCVCRLPEEVESVDGAAVGYVGLTAWSSVVVSGMVVPGDAHGKRVLVLGASGGVGSFVCQLLSAWGAQVTGVCSADAMDLVQGLGAEPMDYRDPATLEILKADGGYHLVLDASGSDGLEYLGALRPWSGGSYVTLSPPLLRNIGQMGIVGGVAKSLGEVVQRNARTVSEGRFYKWAFFMPNHCALKHITKLLATHQIRSIVDRAFPFSQTPEAYSHVLAGHARGKTVITMS